MVRLCILAVAELALLSVLNFFGDLSVAGNQAKFTSIFFLAAAIYWLLARAFEHVPARSRAAVFWILAILFRLVLFPMAPGDDVWRYVWEGRIQAQGFNPYLLAPQAPELVALREEGWEKINHPEWSAIYPPGAQLCFAWLARVSAKPWFFKLAFTAADLCTLLFLLRLNTGPGRYRQTAWYAWCPAVALAFAGAAHFDSLMLLPMTLALWTLRRAEPPGEGEPSWAWACLSAVLLGLAISIKTIPLLLIPAWLFALRRRSVVLTISLLIPFALSLQYGGVAAVTKSVREFAHVTRFNDLVWWLVEKTIWANPAQTNGLFNILLFAVVGVIAVVFRKDWRRSALWILGAALILSPALHPWYVTWILPLACWRGQRAWFALALSGVASLLLLEPTAASPALVRALVLLPPLAAFLRQYRHRLLAHEPSNA